ncbi:MAG: molybdopterin-dependent oxidoreductase [SAR324 cluster bacterium]|nr:molybdopterin-dependent oxidoreductase [SAR324 cluster bacterium]
MTVERIPVYCSQCVAGPDLIEVEVEDGVAKRIVPNFNFHQEHPAQGRVCVKAYGLIQKMYNPNRIKTPLKRTNPKKGKDEDPGWVEISWDEAIEMVAEKLRAIREKGLVDESNNPRLALTLGQGGVAPGFLGTFPAFMSAWGPLDQSIGAGQGVKCYHSEHLYGEFWHRAFIVVPDTPLCKYVLSFGNNGLASAGVTGVWRHAEAKDRGLYRVQVEPHMSISAAFSDQWLPIKPKTDPAFLFAMIHHILHENDWREVCDVPFLRDRTSSPYLVAPNGYYLRDPQSGQPLVWDEQAGAPVPHDAPGAKHAALAGTFTASGVEQGADEERWEHDGVEVRTAFQMLLDHIAQYSADWAAGVCDIPAEKIRAVAADFLKHAHVGETIEVEGREYPYRPVAIMLGKTVANGWGGYESCWGRTMLAVLVGALEVPGAIIGSGVRLNRPAFDRFLTVKPGPDGFMDGALNPTDKKGWVQSRNRSAFETLVPLLGNGPWAPALGPAHLPWLFMENTPRNWPEQKVPDVWINCRSNPAISHWDTDRVLSVLSKIPFTLCFGYTPDETNWFADVILPEGPDTESTQLIRIGGAQFIEQFWRHSGWAIRQPVTEKPVYDTMDMTEITTRLAQKVGILAEYNEAINNGRGIGISLKKFYPEGALNPERSYSVEEIWDRAARACTLEASRGKEMKDLAWFKKNGAYLVPFPQDHWYLDTVMREKGLRYELPYQERLKRMGNQLGNRLHEIGVDWWEEQLAEYNPLPPWKDFPAIWDSMARDNGKDPADYGMWMLTTRSMQYAWGSTVSLPIIADIAANIETHFGVILNTGWARENGIADGDQIWVESPVNRAKGKAVLKQGIRPDVVLTTQQFGHWITPVAKDLDTPNLNRLATVGINLTDATGSGADLVPVRVYKT